MTTINLLPWRERLRKQNKRQLLLMMLVAVVAALVINVLWYLALQPAIHHQDARNDFLQQEITTANAVLAGKVSFDKKKLVLMDQMHTIESLHNQRYRVIALLNTLPKILPNSVYVNLIEMKDDNVALEGESPADVQVSELVHALNRQPGWHDVQLEEIKALPSGDKTKFQITFAME